LAGEVSEAASWQLHGSHPLSRHSPLHTPQLSPPAQPRHSHGTVTAQPRHSADTAPTPPKVPPQHCLRFSPSPRPSIAPAIGTIPLPPPPPAISPPASSIPQAQARPGAEGGIMSGVVDEERYRAGKSAEGDWGPGMGTLRAVPCAEEAGQNGNKSGCGDARLPFVSASA
jgi:hypothetical protein